MTKKNVVKSLIIIGIVILVVFLFHLVGSNMISMIKNHMGL